MRSLKCLCFPLLVFSIAVADAQDVAKDESVPEITDEKPMSFWMEKKIEYSKEILGALTASRYEDIEKRADQLRLLGKIEGFVRGRNPEYAKHLAAFDLATRELKRQAQAKNSDAATKAFHRLTTSCVECHYSLRETQTGD
jgi:hypothetical protein